MGVAVNRRQVTKEPLMPANDMLNEEGLAVIHC